MGTTAVAMPEVSKKPTLGRIVLFQFQNGLVSPAIVVNIRDEGDVDLQVFHNENHVMAYRPHVTEGTNKGQWRWPPKA